MREYLIFAIFLYLSKNKKTTANEIALNFNISTRSVYRYIDILSLLGFPVTTKQGKGGGVNVVGNFYIEKFSLTAKDKGIIKEYLLRKDIPLDLRKILESLVS